MTDCCDTQVQSASIFDSRQAVNVYECETFVRSSGFTVLAGQAAVLEMTTHDDYRGCTTFYIIREAAQLTDPLCPVEPNCALKTKYDKVYRCYTPEKEVYQGPPTAFTDDNKSILRLGWDRYNNRYNDFAHISRPGNYYLVSEKCDSPNLLDCGNPTFVDMTLVPFQLTGFATC